MKRQPLPSAISRELELRETLPIKLAKSLSEQWIKACRIDQHSEGTIAFRRIVLSKFFLYADRENIETIGINELRGFLEHLTNGHTEPDGRFANPKLKQKLRPSTVATYHRDLRAWFNWMTREGEVDISAMERIPTPTHRADQVQPFSCDSQ